MTTAYLSAMWAHVAPALGNHLWQSTLFAVAAGLLTLILRKNHARARYWLWLAASVKFLVPFSILVDLGSRLAWSRAFAGTQAGLSFAVEEISQPFRQSTIIVPAASQSASFTVSASLFHLLPAILLVTWLCGFAAVLVVWCIRWRRISATLRESVPLRAGAEVNALRRVKCVAGLRTPIAIVLSRASLEPGIFGIARPVLIWPEGISKHLEDAHLEAVLAHEVWHVRRRDNLAAAIHMLVEALFWFHPLVWWLGARLVEERERACDEEVVAMGSARQVYAESILKVCEFCVGSPLACVSGVTGADLKKRMVFIMTEQIARKLALGKKILLSTAGVLALALPIVFGLMNAPQSRAQERQENAPVVVPDMAASIRPHKSSNAKNEPFDTFFSPNAFKATGVTVRSLIGEAYGVQQNQIAGAPEWVDSEKYDIDVKMADEPVTKVPQTGIGIERMRLMLQALLAERFQLTLRRENRETAVYALMVADGGPKLQEVKSESGPRPIGADEIMPKKSFMTMGPGELVNQGASLVLLVQQLSQRVGRPVVDQTGLKGAYDFSLRWAPDENGMLKSSEPVDISAQSSESSGSSIFTAVQEQLGLKLEAKTLPLQTLVIDHVERPVQE